MRGFEKGWGEAVSTTFATLRSGTRKLTTHLEFNSQRAADFSKRESQNARADLRKLMSNAKDSWVGRVPDEFEGFQYSGAHTTPGPLYRSIIIQGFENIHSSILRGNKGLTDANVLYRTVRRFTMRAPYSTNEILERVNSIRSASYLEPLTPDSDFGQITNHLVKNYDDKIRTFQQFEHNVEHLISRSRAELDTLYSDEEFINRILDLAQVSANNTKAVAAAKKLLQSELNLLSRRLNEAIKIPVDKADNASQIIRQNEPNWNRVMSVSLESPMSEYYRRVGTAIAQVFRDTSSGKAIYALASGLIKGSRAVARAFLLFLAYGPQNLADVIGTLAVKGESSFGIEHPIQSARLIMENFPVEDFTRRWEFLDDRIKDISDLGGFQSLSSKQSADKFTRSIRFVNEIAIGRWNRLALEAQAAQFVKWFYGHIEEAAPGQMNAIDSVLSRHLGRMVDTGQWGGVTTAKSREGALNHLKTMALFHPEGLKRLGVNYDQFMDDSLALNDILSRYTDISPSLSSFLQALTRRGTLYDNMVHNEEFGEEVREVLLHEELTKPAQLERQIREGYEAQAQVPIRNMDDLNDRFVWSLNQIEIVKNSMNFFRRVVTEGTTGMKNTRIRDSYFDRFFQQVEIPAMENIPPIMRGGNDRLIRDLSPQGELRRTMLSQQFIDRATETGDLIPDAQTLDRMVASLEKLNQLLDVHSNSWRLMHDIRRAQIDEVNALGRGRTGRTPEQNASIEAAWERANAQIKLISDESYGEMNRLTVEADNYGKSVSQSPNAKLQPLENGKVTSVNISALYNQPMDEVQGLLYDESGFRSVDYLVQEILDTARRVDPAYDSLGWNYAAVEEWVLDQRRRLFTDENYKDPLAFQHNMYKRLQSEMTTHMAGTPRITPDQRQQWG